LIALAVTLAAPAMGSGAELSSRFLKITYAGSAGLHLAVPMQPCDPATQTPCELGTATEDLKISGFSSAFDPIPITAENKVSGAFVGQATSANMFIAGSYDAHSEYSPYYNETEEEHCNAIFSLDPSTPPAVVHVAPTGPRSGLVIAEIPPKLKSVSSDCTPNADSFPSAEHFPQIFFVKADISPAMLEAPRREIPVDEAGNALTRYPGDCTAEAQQDNSSAQSCSRTVTLAGKLVLEPVCAVMRMTREGAQARTLQLAPGAPPIGIAAPTTVDWGDGNVMQVGKGSEISATHDCFTFRTGEPSILKLLTGRIYGAITRGTGAAIGAVEGAIAGATRSGREASTAGTPRARFTLSIHGRNQILHVISGGVVLTERYHRMHVSAGQTLLLLSGGGHRNTTWPAADRKLAAQR
jgi:hypothetical protein